MAAKKKFNLTDWLASLPKWAWVLATIAAILIMVAPLAWDAVTLTAVRQTDEDTSADRLFIRDDADLLTDAEEQALESHMLPITTYGEVAFITNPSTSYVSSTESWTRGMFDSLFSQRSGIIVAIDMYNRYIYIFTNGTIGSVISTSDADTITDNIYRYVRAEEYAAAADEAFDEITVMLQGGNVSQPMKHASNALLAFASALIIVFIIANNKTRMKIVDEGNTIAQARTKSVTFQADSTRVTGQTRTKRESTVVVIGGGGGGFGGGGFSGGGGSFGGGGGFSGGGHGGGHGF